MKRILLTALMIGFTTIQGFALNVNINNQPLQSDVPPQIIDGRTMLPVSAIAQNLGAKVEWESSTKTVKINSDKAVIDLPVGKSQATVNSKIVALDVPAQIVSGRTMVPVSFVAQNMGLDVQWNGETKTVSISSNTTKTPVKEDKKQDDGYKTIVVDGGNLSGHREPNVKVDVGFGSREYWAYTNAYGQLVKVTADKITLQDEINEPVTSKGRYYKDEAKVKGVESKTLDEGHVIADSLGGVSNAYNITPQNSTLNRHGDQAYMEKMIREAIRNGGSCTDFVATITYPNTSTQIPSHYSIKYVLNGNPINEEFDNVNIEKTEKQEPKKQEVKKQEPVKTTKTQGKIHANKKSKIYHVPSGRYYDKIKAQNLVYFDTEEEAQKAGYRKSKR